MPNGTQLLYAPLNGSEGVQEGTTATTANSPGAGTITIGANNQQYYTEEAAEGDFALRFALGTTNASIHSYSYTGQTARTVRRFKLKLKTLGGSVRMIAIRNSAGAAGYFGVGSTGVPFLLGASGSATTGATALTADTEYAVEVAITPGTTTSDGVLAYRITPWGNDATTVDTLTLTTANTGTTAVQTDRLGAASVVSAVTDFIVDDYRVHSLASGWIGPTTPPPALATSLTSAMFTIDARASVPGAPGGALTYTIAPSTGVTEPVEGLFVGETPAVGAAAIDYTITVTETSTGLTATGTVTVPARAAGTYTSPVRIRRGSEF